MQISGNNVSEKKKESFTPNFHSCKSLIINKKGRLSAPLNFHLTFTPCFSNTSFTACLQHLHLWASTSCLPFISVTAINEKTTRQLLWRIVCKVSKEKALLQTFPSLFCDYFLLLHKIPKTVHRLSLQSRDL